MNLTQFEHLIDAYGADELHWPDEHREAMIQLRDRDPIARQLIAAASELDLLLNIKHPVPINLSNLERRIIDSVGPTESAKESMSWLDRFVEWLIPEQPALFWRPALAASLPLIFGLMIGTNFDLGVSTQDTEITSDMYLVYESTDSLGDFDE